MLQFVPVMDYIPYRHFYKSSHIMFTLHIWDIVSIFVSTNPLDILRTHRENLPAMFVATKNDNIDGRSEHLQLCL